VTQEADLILENAEIITCDPGCPRAEAMAIKHNRITAIGSREAVGGMKSSRTRTLDCQGKTLIPGFQDAHCHFYSSLRKLFSLDFSPEAVKSIRDIQTVLKNKARYIPAGTWLSGTDYNEFYLAEKRHPTRRDLDEAAPDHPVILTHRSLHACVLNSTALKKVGLHFESEEPPGGIIDRELESGEPNGILYEMLSWVQARIKSPLSGEELRWGIQQLNRRFLEWGITSFTDATVTNDLKQLADFERLSEENQISSRMHIMLGAEGLPADQRQEVRQRPHHNKVRTGALKIVISAATGQIRPAQEELNRLVLEVNRAGFQAAIHAVETPSIAAAVTALEYAQGQLPERDFRNRIEHCSECSPDLAVRLARLKAVVVTQPPFLYFQGERYRIEVPPEIQPALYAFKMWKEAGLKVAGSSDSPVVKENPIFGLYAAITRRTRSGQALLPEQRLSAAEALEMYTRQAAYANFEEEESGSLGPGKLADYLVLSGNPLTCPPQEILNLRVEKTFIGGHLVWDIGETE
jgi:predicted amidohydrolase YtcJ